MTVTPEKLVNRLKEVTGTETDMQLAIELGVALRTVQSWKKGKGMSFPHTLALLERAGWLSVDGPGATTQASVRRAQQLAKRLRAVSEDLERLLTDPES